MRNAIESRWMRKVLGVGMIVALGHAAFAQGTGSKALEPPVPVAQGQKPQPANAQGVGMDAAKLGGPASMGALGLGGKVQGPVVLKVGDELVSLADFRHIFLKNNRDPLITTEALDAYMELFINFKLKVQEAERRGMDTTQKFLQELAGYRAQLARPYLNDQTLQESLVREAFDRRQWEVRARHILVNCAENASPADTLNAWKRAEALRKRVLAGEPFEIVARSKGGSDDPSAEQNGGDLGWFTAFQMVYPFESAAYNTPEGQISPIVRTRFGYHILEVTGRRPARGEVKVAHILIRTPEPKDANAINLSRARINEVHRLLTEGADWREMTLKFSEDASTASKGGELAAFSTGRMVEAFEDAAFSLSADGEISQPFRTDYGWHIVKRLSYKPLQTFEQAQRELEKKVMRDSRADRTRASFLEQLKRETGFTMDNAALASVRALASKTDSCFHPGHPLPALKPADGNRVLVRFADQTRTLNDFATYLNNAKARNADLGTNAVIDAQLKAWTEEMLIAHEDARLELKHTDFRLLMEEYHDGILLFELTDQEVWSRAVKDSAGLEAFFLAHPEKFSHAERLDARVLTCSPGALKAAKKALKKGQDLAELQRTLQAQDPLALRVEEGVYERGANHWVDQAFAQLAAEGKLTRPGGQVLSFDSGAGVTVLVEVRNYLPVQPKSLSETRGVAIAAYQDHLEAQWVAALRAKTPFTVYREALHSLAQ
ncbi:MAG: hypothetical protein RJA19_1496 [Bacteroidota bacterium]|jgi:peptidyl-prolyl cis-trans isomerase SurA